MLEFASVSTRVPGSGSVTVAAMSRTRFSVACSFHDALVPAPVPPSVTW